MRYSISAVLILLGEKEKCGKHLRLSFPDIGFVRAVMTKNDVATPHQIPYLVTEWGTCSIGRSYRCYYITIIT